LETRRSDGNAELQNIAARIEALTAALNHTATRDEEK